MANTIRTYVGDGSRVIYPVDFELGYLREEFVFVYSGEDYQTQLDYTWVDSSQIQLVTPVTIGTPLYIRRVVPRDELIVSFTNGAVLKHKNLDNSALQSLMIAEEIQDGFIDTVGVTLQGLVKTNGNVDFKDLYRSINVPSPLDQGDATNKEYVDTNLSNSINNLNDTLVNYVDTANSGKVAKYGDSMLGALGVVESTNPNSAVPREGIVRAIDAAVRGIAGSFPNTEQDFGFIYEAITTYNDYGSIL